MTETTTNVFADRVIRETCNVTSIDTSKMALNSIHLAPFGDLGTRVTGTDSYRAVTAIVNAQPFDQPMIHDPANGSTWGDVVANATPLPGHYPKMEQIFDSARAGIPGVPVNVRPYGGYRRGVSGYDRGASSDIAEWAYFDGERRKPNGIVKLEVTDSTLCVTLGMQVKDPGKYRVPTATMWESRSRELFKVDGELSDTNRTIGVFHAPYLPDFNAVTGIRCGEGELSPLYLELGEIEYVVMPIRVPEA